MLSFHCTTLGMHELLRLLLDSDVLAWLWLKTMALAWLFMALAHKIPSQSHGTWLWPGPGPPVARAMAWVM